MDATRAREGFEDGVLATVAMSVPMLVATLTGTSPMPEPFPKAVVERVVGEDAPTPVVGVLALASHLFYGGTNGAVLAVVGRPVTVRTGLAWGVGLWGVMVSAFMPYVGWGLFGRKLPEGRKASVVALLLHLVYGATLGALLDRQDDRAERSHAETEAPARDDRLVVVNVEW